MQEDTSPSSAVRCIQHIALFSAKNDPKIKPDTVSKFGDLWEGLYLSEVEWLWRFHSSQCPACSIRIHLVFTFHKSCGWISISESISRLFFPQKEDSLEERSCALFWTSERPLLNCSADEMGRWKVTGSKRSYHLHMSSLIPLAVPTGGALSPTSTTSHHADDFPAEKLHAWCPSVQSELQFEYMCFFPPSTLECLFLMLSSGVLIAAVGQQREGGSYTQPISTDLFEEFVFLLWSGVKSYRQRYSFTC